MGELKGVIYRCYATGNVTAPESGLGGLVGWAGANSQVKESFETGNVLKTGKSNTGSLIGDTHGLVLNSYSLGNVKQMVVIPAD